MQTNAGTFYLGTSAMPASLGIPSLDSSLYQEMPIRKKQIKTIHHSV